MLRRTIEFPRRKWAVINVIKWPIAVQFTVANDTGTYPSKSPAQPSVVTIRASSDTAGTDTPHQADRVKSSPFPYNRPGISFHLSARSLR